jgi:hypothetical protein
LGILILRDFTVIGAILDRGQKSERKQYGADLMKQACLMTNRNYSAILATLQITSYALGV